ARPERRRAPPTSARRPRDASPAGEGRGRRPDRRPVGAGSALRSGGRLAGQGRHLPGRRRRPGGGRPVGPFGVRAVLQRLRAGHRRGGGAPGGGPGPAARPRPPPPRVRGGGELGETDWDTAMDRIVQRSRQQLDTLGPGSIGFYTSGQLFLEEYYTLAGIGKAGLGTPHMDGNTRLCTATAAQALKETFGTDGQPAGYTDVDHADTIFCCGHNVAATQTVLWTRIQDRRRGPNPPRLVVVDPRPTPVAREADVHLAIRPGTNLALLNGLLREIIERGWIDRAFIDAPTVGFDQLA